LENDQLRLRLQYLESLSKINTQDFLSATEASRVDWAAALLDTEHTDDMIITVSREKIAREILKLRAEN